MRFSVVPAALTVALATVTMVAGGTVCALAQDFSITNPESPVDPGHRDLLRQLQAWWDLHAFYPRHASTNDEGGNVKVHLIIHTDGNIWRSEVVGSSGSLSLDTAGIVAFRGGFVRPFPPGMPEASMDLTLHYVLAHRHDQPVQTGATPVASRGAFTITNEPVKSPILETMMQRSCTGTIVSGGIRNHSAYGTRSWAEAVFFQTPDGLPWVKFYVGGQPILSKVVQVGKLVQWAGRENLQTGSFTQYTVWADGGNNLNGNSEVVFPYGPLNEAGANHMGTVDLTCATEIVPAVKWSSWFVTPNAVPRGDPP